MGLFRIYPSKDAWITDGHPEDSNSIRASGSNHGASPSLNVFARKADISSGSIELARTLLQFSLTELSGKVYDEGLIPSGSVSYTLKMADMSHADQVPLDFDLFVFPLSRSWAEGNGIDDDNHRDDGYANWVNANATTAWAATGSDFLAIDYGSGSQHFDNGTEDLEVDVTDVVVNWLTGAIGNNGFVVKMGDTEENNSVNLYRKAFHSRETKFIDRMPYLEARWDDVIKDNRNNFAYDQDSALYLYNFVRGELTNLTEPISVTIKDNVIDASASYTETKTATFVSTGIYSASFNVPNTAAHSASWVDVWASGSRAYMTGTFRPLIVTGSQRDQYDEFTLNVNNLQRVYGVAEEARLTVNVRKQGFITHLGSLASASLDLDSEYIEKMYYSVENEDTGEVVIPFGTGSIPYTQLSYNGDGNYFNIVMNTFVPGFKYRIKFLIDINRFDKKIVDDDFTFKVV